MCRRRTLANPERWEQSKPLLVVDAIESGYERVKVLHGVSLELHAGEVVCIIGPNGAGKTTLLRTISGLCRPTGGAIAFKGEALAGAKPHQMARRGLGHCPERRRVFQHLSIEENLIAGFLPGRSKPRTDLFDEDYALFPILDEPSLGLAPLIIYQIFEIVIRLAERGVSIVLVEQNVDLSFEIADFIYALEHGRVHCSGPADKLRGDDRVRDMYLPRVA